MLLLTPEKFQSLHHSASEAVKFGLKSIRVMHIVFILVTVGW
jgi:hypothetical protein